MSHSHWLLTSLIYLGAAVLAVPLARLLGLGSIIGYLVAGIAIGVAEALTMALTAPAWAPLVSFSLLIVVLLARPGRAGLALQSSCGQRPGDVNAAVVR